MLLASTYAIQRYQMRALLLDWLAINPWWHSEQTHNYDDSVSCWYLMPFFVIESLPTCSLSHQSFCQLHWLSASVNRVENWSSCMVRSMLNWLCTQARCNSDTCHIKSADIVITGASRTTEFSPVSPLMEEIEWISFYRLDLWLPHFLFASSQILSTMRLS